MPEIFRRLVKRQCFYNIMDILRHCKAVFFQKGCAGAVPCGHGINKSAV